MTHFADGLRVGENDQRNGSASVRGAAISPIQIYDIVPVALDVDGIAAAQAVAGAGDLTINGALASGGSVTLDVPRAVEIDSDNIGDTTQTATVYGTDVYGLSMTETIAFNGTTAVSGQKAFKTITRVAISAALAGSATCGTTDTFGLPLRVDSRGYCLTAWDGAFVTTGTFTAADTTTATATTNDVRGTFLPPTAADGTRRLTCWMYIEDADSVEGLYGVTQA